MSCLEVRRGRKWIPNAFRTEGFTLSTGGDYTEAQSEKFVIKLGRVFVATSTASERALSGVEAW